ncbi:MAG: cation diffusion facilitator family transporter, partial [Acidimicrobiales bacterium]
MEHHSTREHSALEHSAGANSRRLRIALGLLGSFMVAEVVAGALAGSLVLLADAAHLLADVGAMAGALWAIRLAGQPVSRRWSFGLKRVEILSAAANGLTLLVAAAVIAVEAVARLIHPEAVQGWTLVAVAVAGVFVNLAATSVLARADRRSLNVEGAFRHVVTDLYAFLATLVAGLVIVVLGYRRADAAASLLVVLIMLKASWGLLSASGRVLLQATPEGIDLDEVRRHITELPEVVSVHALHAWTLTSRLPVLSAHVVIDERCIADGSAPQVLDR